MTEGPAEGAAPAPKAKPVELAPNAGLVGVPKLGAVVVVVGAGAEAPKGNGAGAGAAVAAGVADAPTAPKVKGFGVADEEPNADWAAGASKAGLVKEKVDWVVEAGAAVETALAIA